MGYQYKIKVKDIVTPDISRDENIGTLTTLVVPTSGKAIVADINVISYPTLVKQVIGVVTQTNNLDRALTNWENRYYHSRYFRMRKRESHEAADKLLVEFCLSEQTKAEVMAISGVMAKRLQVARALLHSPSVLFLDEPKAGLDPQSRLALWGILHNLHNQGKTILLTTHYVEEADSICDRLAILTGTNCTLRFLPLDWMQRLLQEGAQLRHFPHYDTSDILELRY